LGSVFVSANVANARCENIIKIDLGTRNFQQFLQASGKRYGMRCNSYSGRRRAAATVVSASGPSLAVMYKRLNISVGRLIIFNTAVRPVYS
jgi:hypothetical protein